MQSGDTPVIVWAIGTVIVTVLVAVLTQPPTVTEYVISDVPAVSPVTSPVAGSTVATAGIALDHTPPAVVLVHVSVLPIHKVDIPVIVWAIGAVIVTVCVAVLTQPPTVTEYIISDVPEVTPVTNPVAGSTVATAGVALDHTPPAVVLVQVSVLPIHSGDTPEIICATGAVMVIVFVDVLTHPPTVTEYVISDVPAVNPVTKPVAGSTVATAGVALDHTPPAVVLVQVSLLPIHNGDTPVIVCTIGAVIVTVFVAVFTQPPVVTV
jgi:hypothetical protein